MKMKSIAAPAAVACALLAATSHTRAADVTFERLRNPEPHNWLMHHRDYGAQHFSAARHDQQVEREESASFAFAVALGGTSANENLLATPLVDDGFMYMVDAWGVVYKIDVRSGTMGRILWKMDPGQEKIDRNRGVALWGNLVISVTSHDGRVIATDKETGKIVWDRNLRDQPDMTLNAAPLALADKIIIGASGGDQGVRNWLVALDAKTGNVLWRRYAVPGARRARQRDLEGQAQCLADRRRRLLRHRLLRPRHQHHLLGRRATRRRNTIRPTGPATISTPTARSRSTRRPARSAGTTSTRRTTRWTTTRAAATSSSTPR